MDERNVSIIEEYTPYHAFLLGVFLQIEAWALQVVIGHGFFEGNFIFFRYLLFRSKTSDFRFNLPRNRCTIICDP
jgi:hypothetical protein